jgi:nickel-dependent lactate racemase
LTQIFLKYGDENLPCQLAQATLISLPEIAAADSDTAIKYALNNPLNSDSLAQIVKPGEQVVIVTSDITRYTASEVYLPILVAELNRAGVADNDIEIVIALGIHRKQTQEEHKRIVGALYGRIKVSDHECDDPQALVDIGTTSSGLPIKVNKSVAAADRIIVTGTVGLHYFAGFGGGRKSLVPGVASRETCMATHFAIFNPPETGGKHQAAIPGNLDGNPVHQAILEAAQMLEPDFLFNTVLTPDKRIAAAYAGDLQAAHLAACEAARDLYTVKIDSAADLAIVSCGGQPKDINFIQSHKALDYGVRALKQGGTVILLAACPDGFGNATFFDWFRYQDLDEFETALRDNYEINGQTAHATLEKARRFRVILISSFNRQETETMGMEKAETLDEALAMAYEKLPPNPQTVVIPDGGTILPVIKTK